MTQRKKDISDRFGFFLKPEFLIFIEMRAQFLKDFGVIGIEPADFPVIE